MLNLYTAAGAVAAIVVGLCLVVTHRVPKLNVKGKKVLITGGSAGIGLELAKEFVRRGAIVCIAARRVEVLKEAVEEIKKCAPPGVSADSVVSYITMDVSDPSAVSKAVNECCISFFKQKHVDICVCNAGFSLPARFLDIPPEKAQQMMQINYFGCVNVARAVLPSMYEQKTGRIVLVSSMASAAHIAGFTIYSSTKAAVRAFGAALDMESAARGVRVQIVNPPDVETPGYEEENKTKSPECREICAMGGAAPFKPEAMAKASIDGIENYRFQVSLGFDGWMLGTGTAGMDPAASFPQLLIEVTMSGVLRLVSTVYTKLHYGIVRKVMKKEGLAK